MQEEKLCSSWRLYGVHGISPYTQERAKKIDEMRTQTIKGSKKRDIQKVISYKIYIIVNKLPKFEYNRKYF